MGFLFYFRLSSYLLVGAGFLALLLTEDYGIIAAVIFVAIIVTGWRVDSGKSTIPIAPLVWNFTTIVVLGLCVIDAVFIRKMTSVALVNFLIFLQITKIFVSKQERDYTTIYVISFFQLLISSIMTFSIFFAFSCIFFAITGTWALITLQLKREIETHIIRKDGNQESKIPQAESFYNIPALSSLLHVKFFVSTLGITVLTFGMSAIVFIILPRVQEGFFFRYGSALQQPVSGFSEEVNLGTFGTIRQDHSPVMRVALPDISARSQLPQRLYWKGLSYNHYDGTRWKSDPRAKKLIPTHPYSEKVWFQRPQNAKDLLKQQFELRSSEYRVLFGANVIRSAEGHFLSLQYDRFTGNTEVILNLYSPYYTAFSDISQPPENVLQAEHNSYSETIREFYLQVPPLADRVNALAHQIDGDRNNVYETAVAVQNYLLQNYEYSLSVERTPDLMPIEDFLFVNKAGHCEFYATSMALLLRILGIPTRVVNGFAQGRWNEFGNFFTVRQSDAHAWVEVYFPSYGWVTFDPTPPVAFGDTYQQFVEGRSLIASIYLYTEHLRSKWNRYIVDYSKRDQVRLALGTFSATRSARRSVRYYIRRFRDSIRNGISQLSFRQIGSAAGVLLVFLFVMRLLMRALKLFHIRLPAFKKRPRSSNKQVIRFYKTMLHILARKGISKHQAATPGEFVRHVTQHLPYYSQDVRHITDLYYAVRYGNSSLQPEDLLAIQSMLKNMKKKQKVIEH